MLLVGLHIGQEPMDVGRVEDAADDAAIAFVRSQDDLALRHALGQPVLNEDENGPDLARDWPWHAFFLEADFGETERIIRPMVQHPPGHYLVEAMRPQGWRSRDIGIVGG